MADLIALLLVTVASLMQPGVKEAAFEQTLAATVQREQPAPLREVRVDATGLTASVAEEVEFRFSDLKLDKMTVAAVTFTIKGLKKDKAGKLSISGIAWDADISDDELTRALQADGGKLKDAVVTITADGVSLRGSYPLLFGSRTSFEVTGDLVVEEETWLMYHISKNKVGGIKVPRELNKQIEKSVNPVYDLARFAARSAKEIELAKKDLNYDFNLKVSTLKPRDGHIIITGSA
jgi:hypothetical protein